MRGEVPDGRDGHSACVVNDSMFIFGGYVQRVKKFSNDLYEFNFNSLEWNLIVPKVKLVFCFNKFKEILWLFFILLKRPI